MSDVQTAEGAADAGRGECFCYCRALAQFLKELCLGAWTESLRADRRLTALEQRLAALEQTKKEG